MLHYKTQIMRYLKVIHGLGIITSRVLHIVERINFVKELWFSFIIFNLGVFYGFLIVQLRLVFLTKLALLFFYYRKLDCLVWNAVVFVSVHKRSCRLIFHQQILIIPTFFIFFLLLHLIVFINSFLLSTYVLRSSRYSTLCIHPCVFIEPLNLR